MVRSSRGGSRYCVRVRCREHSDGYKAFGSGGWSTVSGVSGMSGTCSKVDLLRASGEECVCYARFFCEDDVGLGVIGVITSVVGEGNKGFVS